MARNDVAPAACSSVIVGARSAARALARFVMDVIPSRVKDPAGGPTGRPSEAAPMSRDDFDRCRLGFVARCLIIRTAVTIPLGVSVAVRLRVICMIEVKLI